MFLQLLLLLFLPGLSFCEALSVYKRSDTLLFKLGMITGTSLIITTVVFVVLNTWLTPLTEQVIDDYLVVALAAVLFGIATEHEHYKKLFVLPHKSDLLGMTVLALIGVIIWQYHAKYPIFPNSPDTDYIQHTSISQSLLTQKALLPQAIFYYAVEYQLAIAQSGNMLPSIETTRIAMSVITLASVFIMYAALEKTLDKHKALLGTGVYALGFVWVNIVFNSGTWANFMGILIPLTTVTLFASMKEHGRVWGAVVTVISLTALAFSHYTAVAVVPVFVAMFLLDRERPKQGFVIKLAKWGLRGIIKNAKTIMVASLRYTWESYRRSAYLIPVVILTVMVAALGYEFGHTLLTLLSDELKSSQNLPVITDLGNAFPPSSFQSMISVFGDDLAFVVISLSSTTGLVIMFWKRENRNSIAISSWLVITLAMSFFVNDWRFSYVVMVPTIFFASIGLDTVLSFDFNSWVTRSKPNKFEKRRQDVRWKTGWACALILFMLVMGSRSGIMWVDARSYQPQLAQGQESIYHGMAWASKNLNDTALLSNAWQVPAYLGLLFPEGVIKDNAKYSPFTGTAYVNGLRSEGYRYEFYLMVNGTLDKNGFIPVWNETFTTIYWCATWSNSTCQS